MQLKSGWRDVIFYPQISVDQQAEIYFQERLTVLLTYILMVINTNLIIPNWKKKETKTLANQSIKVEVHGAAES